MGSSKSGNHIKGKLRRESMPQTHSEIMPINTKIHTGPFRRQGRPKGKYSNASR